MRCTLVNPGPVPSAVVYKKPSLLTSSSRARSDGAQSLCADHAEAGRGEHEARDARGVPLGDGVEPPRRGDAEQRLARMHTLLWTVELC